MERLHGVLRPFLLRRLKVDVEKQVGAAMPPLLLWWRVLRPLPCHLYVVKLDEPVLRCECGCLWTQGREGEREARAEQQHMGSHAREQSSRVPMCCSYLLQSCMSRTQEQLQALCRVSEGTSDEPDARSEAGMSWAAHGDAFVLEAITFPCAVLLMPTSLLAAGSI